MILWSNSFVSGCFEYFQPSQLKRLLRRSRLLLGLKLFGGEISGDNPAQLGGDCRPILNDVDVVSEES